MINLIKKVVKRVVPTKTYATLNMFREKKKFKKWVLSWCERDFAYNNSSDSKASLEYNIISGAHVIEKGIAMPNRRLGFGYEKVRVVLRQLRRYYNEQKGIDSFACKSAINSLDKYKKIHDNAGFCLPEDIKSSISFFVNLAGNNKDSILEYTVNSGDYFKPCTSFSEFASKRHSVRNYSNEKVGVKELKEAIAVAQTAPSACNRQATRIKIIESLDKKKKLLGIQNGNRGFGQLADKILLVTTDQYAWEKEFRSSAFLDAGIFIMNLLYALHEKHLCACTLNAHFTFEEMNQLWDTFMPVNEIPVALILVGRPLETFDIAVSDRRNVEEIVDVI